MKENKELHEELMDKLSNILDVAYEEKWDIGDWDIYGQDDDDVIYLENIHSSIRVIFNQNTNNVKIFYNDMPILTSQINVKLHKTLNTIIQKRKTLSKMFLNICTEL